MYLPGRAPRIAPHAPRRHRRREPLNELHGARRAPKASEPPIFIDLAWLKRPESASAHSENRRNQRLPATAWRETFYIGRKIPHGIALRGAFA